MSKGRMVAQGAHASMAALLPAMQHEYVKAWLSFVKIVLQVSSTEELQQVYLRAKSASIPCSYIVDNPYSDNPEATAVAVGPAPVELVDAITKDLKLL